MGDAGLEPATSAFAGNVWEAAWEGDRHRAALRSRSSPLPATPVSFRWGPRHRRQRPHLPRRLAHPVGHQVGVHIRRKRLPRGARQSVSGAVRP